MVSDDSHATYRDDDDGDHSVLLAKEDFPDLRHSRYMAMAMVCWWNPEPERNPLLMDF